MKKTQTLQSDPEAKFTQKMATPVEPYSIAKYALDGANQTWVVESPHSQYQGIFKSHTMEGANDWAYNHNRLLSPGQSKIKVQYQLPVEMTRMNLPNSKFILRTAYFAPWKMSPCTITVSVNGEKVLKTVQVLSED